MRLIFLVLNPKFHPVAKNFKYRRDFLREIIVNNGINQRFSQRNRFYQISFYPLRASHFCLGDIFNLHFIQNCIRCLD